MSDTPRTDSKEMHVRTSGDPIGMDVVMASFSRQLERELNEANERIKVLEAVLEILRN